MNTPTLIIIVIGIVVAGIGALYRRIRARGLPDVPDEVFVERFQRNHGLVASQELVLQERRNVASLLSIPAQKLSPEQTVDELRKGFAFFADFSVGANDLYDEAMEARQLAGRGEWVSPPDTVGELLEDLVRGRQALETSKP